MSEHDPVAAAVADVARRSRRVGVEAAFRATVEQRLHNLEAETAEVRTRVNALLWIIAGSVVTEAVLRVVKP